MCRIEPMPPLAPIEGDGHLIACYNPIYMDDRRCRSVTIRVRDLWSRLRSLGRKMEEEIYDFTEEDAESEAEARGRNTLIALINSFFTIWKANEATSAERTLGLAGFGGLAWLRARRPRHRLQEDAAARAGRRLRGDLVRARPHRQRLDALRQPRREQPQALALLAAARRLRACPASSASAASSASSPARSCARSPNDEPSEKRAA